MMKIVCRSHRAPKFENSTTGYSLCPDLVNAATVSVSLIEGNRKERQPNSGEMVLRWQDLEILQSQFFLYSMHTNHQPFGPFNEM